MSASQVLLIGFAITLGAVVSCCVVVAAIMIDPWLLVMLIGVIAVGTTLARSGYWRTDPWSVDW